MRNDIIEVRYTLTFDSGFHCGTGLRQGMLHRGVVRDADGLLYVPGSTMKGTLRDHATQLARFLGLEGRVPHIAASAQTAKRDDPGALAEFAPTNTSVFRIFGSRYRPGTLCFDDALLCQEQWEFFCPPDGHGKQTERFLAQQVEARTRVSMSRITGTAHRHMLFSSEYGTPGMQFEGSISGWLEGLPVVSDASVSYSLLLLLAALASLTHVGGGKSAGLGKVRCGLTSLKINGQEMIDKMTNWLELLTDFEYYSLVAEEEEAG